MVKKVAPWCSGYHFCTTSFNKGNEAGNKAERLSLVNHTTKTIPLHHQFIASASTQIVHYNHIKGSSKRLESYKNRIVKYSISKVYQKFVFQSETGVKMSRLTIALFRRDVM